ncbi:unnamed protein product [Adineta ricciae]|uniref:Uncharacterized protein n=1 Tax=Adineta ricciae TaxID=249248 RepID=A0A815CWQ6_ADIRI|nr:unnamed protein product [Adineta ricciae]CAF1518288.1 unnamed protein product [Adineta ricciae]
MKIVAILLLSSAVFATAVNQHHKIDIIENGIFIQQTITQYDDLQIIEVPEHGDRPHIMVYLDFRSGLQLIKDIKYKKCQLSNMEQETQNTNPKSISIDSSDNGFSIPNLPVDVNSAEKIHVFKLEQEEVIQNTSYLRLEFQQARAGLGIHWANSVNEKDLNSMIRNGEIFYDREKKIIMRPTHTDSRLNQRSP